MNRVSIILGFLLLFLVPSCIERYYLDEDEIRSGMLVVVAHLDDHPGLQSVFISRTVSISNTNPDPVYGCYVEVERQDGELRIFDELEEGEYQADLDAAFLTAGSQYRLSLVLPEGKYYESEFETLYPFSAIDSLYFSIENQPTADPEAIDQGIRFFIDFEVEKDSGRYLRWQLVETFEIHNPDLETRMYGTDRRWYTLRTSDKTLDCWATDDVSQIFTRDMGNVGGETYRQLPLNYISGHDWRIQHRYSLLVRQLSLSEKAYWYWSELAKNVQATGGMFDKQPSLTPSNICNVSDPEEKVVGYFSISGVSEKRIFVENVPGLVIYRDPYYCAPIPPVPGFLWRYPSENLPLYVAYATISGVYEGGKLKEECVDCRLYKNSSHVKPDFW